jgi:hypothetical protein
VTLRIISATREPRENFGNTPLGRSIPRLRKPPQLHIEFDNEGKKGLPEVYNEGIQAADPGDTLLFVHDDVVLGDFDLEDTLNKALETYDVVGVAGGKHDSKGQVTWFGDLHTIDKAIRGGRLSGAVPHIVGGEQRFSIYGPAPQEVQLLDGVFLATRWWGWKGVGPWKPWFDPQFKFHFYDLDFCRTMRASDQMGRPMTLGTWFIPIIHMPSSVGYQTPEWEAAKALYLKKWEER